jgi:hypothetical protein
VTRRDQLPPHLRAKVEEQLALEHDTAQLEREALASVGARKFNPAERSCAKRPPRGMSKVERSYRDLLEWHRAGGNVVAFEYEPLRLVLADRLTYCPDFAVLRARSGRVELVEVKPRRADGTAYWTEDSRIKIKAAAERYGVLFSFSAAWPCRRDGRGPERGCRSCARGTASIDGWHHEDFFRREGS